MASIAVFHPDLHARGGGEGVCLNAIQALKRDHDVTLVTLLDPDLPALDDYYGTAVESVDVDRGGTGGRLLTTAGSVLGLPDHRLWKVRAALLKRAWNPTPYDLVVSTYNELTFDLPAVQYVHYPNRAGAGERLHRWVYRRLFETVDGTDRERIRSGTLVANSDWTASVTDDLYGVYPRVVYPPVLTDDFDLVPWTEREAGFVSVGRIEPSKNLLRNVEIVSRVRDRGFDVSLHIVGPVRSPDYDSQLRERVADLDFVTREGELSRADLVDLLSRHRYGLHGKECEHFGMAVAELVAAGTVPFVPNSGGQREIVGEEDRVMYRSVPDAVDRITTALTREDEGAGLRKSFPSIEERFSQDRFREAIREAVADELAAR